MNGRLRLRWGARQFGGWVSKVARRSGRAVSYLMPLLTVRVPWGCRGISTRWEGFGGGRRKCRWDLNQR